MRRPRVYKGTKREFFSTDLVHAINGYFPFLTDGRSNKSPPPITETSPHSYQDDRSVPAKFSRDQIKQMLPKGVWDGLVNLDEGGLLRYSKMDKKPYHIWNNKQENEVKDTPMHTDKFFPLYSLLSVERVIRRCSWQTVQAQMIRFKMESEPSGIRKRVVVARYGIPKYQQAIIGMTSWQRISMQEPLFALPWQ